LRARLGEIREEREAMLAASIADEAATEATLRQISAQVDTNERRLLTAQGNALVAATEEALRALGFLVENVDDMQLGGAPRLEDLRVSDSDDARWTNITEVRGYTGGAKVSDLQRLGRFAGLYQQRTGAQPRTRWYIVNQFIETAPEVRRRPLAGSEEDIAVFAEDGGLVIDTRDLFILSQKVASGDADAREIREMLREMTGALPEWQ